MFTDIQACIAFRSTGFAILVCVSISYWVRNQRKLMHKLNLLKGKINNYHVSCQKLYRLYALKRLISLHRYVCCNLLNKCWQNVNTNNLKQSFNYFSFTKDIYDGHILLWWTNTSTLRTSNTTQFLNYTLNGVCCNSK